MNQRLSLEEVQEIARLASQRRSVVHGQGPTVDRVADALGLSPGQVESLVAEIRDRKAGLLPPDDEVIFKRLGLGAAALVALLVAFLAFNFFVGSGAKEPTPTMGTPAVASFGSPVERRSDPPPSVAPSGSPAVAPTPGAPVDPGFSGGSLGATRTEVKDYSTDLSNARSVAKVRLMEAESTFREASSAR